MKKLNYKGLVFDDFAQDDDGNIWAEICQNCVKKHRHLISDVIDDGGTASACCSVEGCFNNGYNSEKHYYIDFNLKFVTFFETSEEEDYDKQYT